MGVFCTLTDKIEDENGTLKQLKFRLDSVGGEAIIENKEEELRSLLDRVKITFRVLQKTGTKLTIEGLYFLNVNFAENIKNIFNSAGLKSSEYKLFDGEKLLKNDTEIAQIYKEGTPNYIYAFESRGKPKKWKRFYNFYDYNSWSCGGSSSDGIIFIPKKDVSISGFMVFVPRDGNTEFEAKYKILVDDRVVEEGPTKKYTDWEDNYYKSIMFEDSHDVSANSRIDIILWLAKDISTSYSLSTYSGSGGDQHADVENDDKGLFSIESSNNSPNYTSISSGQIPGILYHI